MAGSAKKVCTARDPVWRREEKSTKNCWRTNCKVGKYCKNSTKVYYLGQLSVVSHSNTLNPLWSIVGYK